MIPSFFKIRFVLLIAGFLFVFFLIGAGRSAFASESGFVSGQEIFCEGGSYLGQNAILEDNYNNRSEYSSASCGSHGSVTVFCNAESEIRVYVGSFSPCYQERWTINGYTTGDDPLDVDNDEDGYTENEGDCNDTDAFINPGATDVCGDGIDNDCSGSDETCSTDPLDIDDDEDGYTENEGDCNDTDSSINPWAYDIPDDGIDQDCSGTDASSGSGGDPEPTPGPGAFEDFNIETEGLSDSSKDLNHSFLDYSFKDRFSRFFADLKGTGIFNVVDNPVSDIPTIGSSVIDIDAGVYGQHSFDFAGWSSGLIILRSLFLICASWVAIKMLVLKK